MNIGVTGHRHLDDPNVWKWVKKVIEHELDSLPPPLTAVTCLANGADQLFATLIASRGGQIFAIVPFENYDRTFAGPPEAATYRRLLSWAKVEVLHTLGTDEDAYLAAGYRVVESADLLLAVWDGKPARGKGGTADIVAYAERKRTPWIHLNPIAQTIGRHK